MKNNKNVHFHTTPHILQSYFFLNFFYLIEISYHKVLNQKNMTSNFWLFVMFNKF